MSLKHLHIFLTAAVTLLLVAGACTPEWEYDMMEDIKVRFEWMQTGGWERVSYHYPFTAEWNKNTYTREQNGQIYIREPAVRK